MKIDEYLRRFRPLPVPPELRARVLANGRAGSSWRVLLRVAALVLLVALTVYANVVLEHRVRRQLGAATAGLEAEAGRPAPRLLVGGGIVGRGVGARQRTGPTWASLRLEHALRSS